jgi:hypothetical protein
MAKDKFHYEYKSGYHACFANFYKECVDKGVVELCFNEEFIKNPKSGFNCGWTDALIEIANKAQKYE